MGGGMGGEYLVLERPDLLAGLSPVVGYWGGHDGGIVDGWSRDW